MSIFHIINFKKKSRTQGILDFLNKKLVLDYYFCLKLIIDLNKKKGEKREGGEFYL
jgi:hypothetical protein